MWEICSHCSMVVIHASHVYTTFLVLYSALTRYRCSPLYAHANTLFRTAGKMKRIQLRVVILLVVSSVNIDVLCNVYIETII